MPLTRVYLPLTPADLTGLAEGRPLGPAPRNAHAVTPALGKPGLVTDEEELEHAAWVAATEEAGAAPGGARRRRVIAAADVDAAIVVHPTSPDVPSRVEVVGSGRTPSHRVVPRRRGARVHRADRPALVRRHRARRRAGPRRPALTHAPPPPPPGSRHPRPRGLRRAKPGRKSGGIPTSRPERGAPPHGRCDPRPHPHQRDRARLRPREPRAGLPRGGARRAGRDAPRAAAHHRRRPRHGEGGADRGPSAARPPQGARRDPGCDQGGCRCRRRCRDRRRPGLARPLLRRPCRHPAQGRRPPRRAVAREDQRRDDAGPEQDGLPGRDRRRLRAHRLLALQRALRPPDHGGAAPGQLAAGCGTAATTARSRASSTRSRRSTSPRSPATCRPRRR